MSGDVARKAGTPSRVIEVPGSNFLSTLVIMTGLLGGILYVTLVGSGGGVLALVGVCLLAVLLLVLGVVVRQNVIIIEADEHDMILRPYPLRIGRTRRVPRGDIGGFMKEMVGTTKSGTPRYAVIMLRGSRRPRRLAFFDTDEDSATEAEEKLTAFFT